MSGIDGIVTQDHAVNESQGPIVDRSREHLGTSDVAVIGMRQRMLRAARELQAGIEPPGLDPTFPFERILSETFDAPADVAWYDASRTM
jgi:phthalate 4,5-dioxygenase